MSQISSLIFFLSEKEPFSWTYLLKKAKRRRKIIISPVWNKILKIWDIIFELIQIEVQCSKNYFNFFLPQEAWAFGNNIEKNPQKPRPKVKTIIYHIFTGHICSVCNPVQVIVFCKNVSILQKNDSNFVTLKKVAWFLKRWRIKR